jgi:hypothetical protein
MLGNRFMCSMSGTSSVGTLLVFLSGKKLIKLGYVMKLHNATLVLFLDC